MEAALVELVAMSVAGAAARAVGVPAPIGAVTETDVTRAAALLPVVVAVAAAAVAGVKRGSGGEGAAEAGPTGTTMDARLADDVEMARRWRSGTNEGEGSNAACAKEEEKKTKGGGKGVFA